MKTLSERPFDHRFELTTGKVFVANRFIIGLSTNLQVFEGYDGTLFEQDFTIAERMEIANVDYLSEGLGLPAKNPEFREEKQRLLIGLDLISDAMDRLLDASETVTLNNPSADGLRSVLGIKIDGGGRNSLSRARRRPRRTGRNRNAAASLGEEIKVSAKFRCDALTLELFLEALLGNQEKRPLVLSEIKVKDDNSDNSNEALLVNLVLLALLEKR